jgi:hypothetical protein
MAYNDSTDANIGDLENPPYDEVQFDSESSAAYQFGIGYKIDSMFTIELSLQHNAGFELEGPYYDNGILLADTKTTVDLQTTAVMMNGQLDI